MENEEKELTPYFELLLNSPMFNLSLSSKELFHSNFLAWIWDIDKNMFCSLFNLQYQMSYVLKREYYNFDICIIDTNITTSKKNQLENVVFVLENKVKSIANAEQLIRYRDATPNAKHVLLSLATKFPSSNVYKKDKVENDRGWNIMSYEELATLLSAYKDNIALKNTEYIRLLLDDYIGVINALHKIAQKWSDISLDSRYFIKNIVSCDTDFYRQCAEKQIKKSKKNKLELDYAVELRIKDLREKLRVSALVDLVKEQLTSGLKFHINISMNGDIWATGEDVKSKISEGDIKLGTGFTNGNGFLEVESRVPVDKIKGIKNLVLMIQVQGNQYRHAIISKEALNQNDVLDNITREFKSFLNFEAEFSKKLNLLSKKNCAVKPRKYKGIEREYCKFGNNFIYRYVKIDSQKVKNKDVIDNILKDIKLINDLYINPIHTSK